MMVLHPATATSKEQQLPAAVRPSAMRRRRSSKGTIAGFAKSKDTTTALAQEGLAEKLPCLPLSSPTEARTVIKPCHMAHLALAATINAVQMGAPTYLNLCPPRARRELRNAMHKQRLVRQQHQQLAEHTVLLQQFMGENALQLYEAQEKEYLNSNALADDSDDDEMSSGDEEGLRDIAELFSEESTALDKEQRNLREPLYTPVTTDGVSKRPFARRKIRFFDGISAAETSTARSYLENEARRSKRRSAMQLTRLLKRAQGEEWRRKWGQDAAAAGHDNRRDTPEERDLLDGGLSRISAKMTPAMAAALILESLAISKLESLEGMAMCYDGIVAAGMAIVGSRPDLSGRLPDNENKSRTPSRSEIVSALAPLLISSLEQPSGDVILHLAKLRRMCGTLSYQRRFVQRVAPVLVRPPRGAVWCLRHQNDMESILAATELIFDAASDIFSKGWHERGQFLLADSKRAKTLDSAAKQLRSLSNEPAADSCFNLGLSGHSSHKWLAARKRKEAVHVSSEPLAEWEVVAVVGQIKVSISSVMGTDWSRVTAQADVPRPFRRAFSASTKNARGVLQSSSVDASPKSAIVSSPRSPARQAKHGKTPHSPPHLPSSTLASSSESLENAFGTMYSQPTLDRAMSPTPPGPPSSRVDSFSASTPPKSPKSPQRESLRGQVESAPTTAPLSPKRGKIGVKATLSLGGAAPSTIAPILTPLSPSASSVGTSGSGELVSYRPSASSVASMSSASGTSTSYRMLTSTAAERKRTVAACRALRAQIQRFEDAFVQLHGRPPKGAAERAPLATTYAQYREWKRAIRADAACRIQALLRGSHTRSKQLRKNNAKLSQIVMKRPGRPGYVGDDSIMNHISIPVEIGDATADPSPPLAAGTAPAPSFSEGYGSSGPALSPQWASTIRRRNNSGDRVVGESLSSPPSATRRPLSSPTSQGSSSSTSSDLSHLSLDELQARKRDLKRQLKQYDITFARRHGRMPVKAEKEPIRHLYESYNSLKNQITHAEQEGRLSQTSSPLSSVPLAHPDSPSAGSDSGQSASEDTTIRAGPLPTRPNRRRAPRDVASPPITSGAANNLTSQDLQTLKAEKTQLHQMLRSYERDFFEEHRRQVSSFGDIRPVASQYRRYKEIKKTIAAIQQPGDS
jgi:hypothetical protein